MAATKQWLESDGQKTMHATLVKTSKLADLTKIEEKSSSVSDLKLDGCALSWTENQDTKTTFFGKDFSSVFHFKSSHTILLENIQPKFTRVNIDRESGDQPAYLAYMQTSRATIIDVYGEVAGEGTPPNKKIAPPKRSTERSARIFVTTLDEAHHIVDAVLRAAALCGAR